MDQPQDKQPDIIGQLSDREVALVVDFRRCSIRRQVAIERFTRKLAAMDVLPPILEIQTNILEFRRRRDD